MALGVKTKRWLGWGLAALMLAFVWSAGGYWHDVVAVLVAVSLVVILADMKKCSTDGPNGEQVDCQRVKSPDFNNRESLDLERIDADYFAM